MNGYRRHPLIATVVVCGLVLLSIEKAQAATLNSVQAGAVTMPAGGGASQTVNVAIFAVDPAQSILFFNYRGDSDQPNDGQVRGQLTGSTNIQFFRANDSSLTDLTIQWYVVEFASGVSVQRGTLSPVNSSSNVTISAVDLSRSFVLVSGSETSEEKNYGKDDFLRARLTSPTNLEIIPNGGALKAADWQVIEHTGTSVQRGISSLTDTQTTATVPITAVDLTRSIVLLSWKTSISGTGANFLRARLTNSTEITIDRAVGTSATIDYAWEVVEFTDGTGVQSGNLAFASTDTSLTETLTTVDTARTVALLSTAGGGWGGTHAFTANDQIGPGMFSTAITDPTTLTVSRQITGSVAADAAWFVIEFSPDIAGSVSLTESAGATDVNEAGPSSDIYTIVLNTQPTADVTITVSPDAQTDVGSGPGTAIDLTFTAADWSVVQTVTVTAVDDAVIEGAHTSTIMHTTGSADANYNGIAIVNITANVTDNDTAGVTLAESDGVTLVNEAGPSSDTYTIVLNTQPTADVTITVSPDAQTDVGSGPGTAIDLTFTAADWSVAQTVTVTAVDDAVIEGAHSSTITHSATSTDADYNGLTIAAVTASVADNDDVPIDGGGGGSGDSGDGSSGTTAPKPEESNQPPVADAGPDQTVEPGTEVLLSALESFDPDGDALIYAWVQVSQPLVADRYDLPFPEPSWSFIAPAVPSTTVYEFELTVTDAGTPPLSATDRVVITVVVEPNKPPVAVTNSDQSVLPGKSVVLSGEESKDPDGNLPLTFLWTQSDGPSIMDAPVEAVAIEFEAPTFEETTTLTFQLTVTDDGNPPLSSHTTVEVTVIANMPPVAVAGPDQTAFPGDLVVLSGEDSFDPDFGLPLTFVWTQIDGPKIWDGSFEGKLLEFEVPEFEEPTTLIFELSVTDSGVRPRTSKAFARVVVTPSLAAAGGDQRAPVLCGVGLPLLLSAMSLVMLVGTRRGREAVRSAARMLVYWVLDARRGRTYDQRALGKRRRPRWSWSKEVVVRLDERQRPVRVPTADISEGGIKIWFPELLQVGQNLQLGDRVGDAWLQARVVHVADEPNEQGMYRIGIHFVDEDTSA